MTRFEETVAKIAASPSKRETFKQIPRVLFKHAAVGAAVAPSAWRSVLPDIVKNVAGAGALGAGAWGAGKLLDNFDQTSDRLEAERKQMGQLTGEQKFRTHALSKLSPMHESVFSTLGQDPILAKADPELIHSTFDTMKRFAPHMASDPNAARAFLRESALYGTGPSYASLKTLADAEQSVARAGGLGG